METPKEPITRERLNWPLPAPDTHPSESERLANSVSPLLTSSETSLSAGNKIPSFASSSVVGRDPRRDNLSAPAQGAGPAEDVVEHESQSSFASPSNRQEAPIPTLRHEGNLALGGKSKPEQSLQLERIEEDDLLNSEKGGSIRESSLEPPKMIRDPDPDRQRQDINEQSQNKNRNPYSRGHPRTASYASNEVMSISSDGTSPPRQNRTARVSSPEEGPSTPGRNRASRASMTKDLSPVAYGKSPVRSTSGSPVSNFNSYRSRTRYSWQSAHDDEPNRPRIHIIKLFSDTVTASAAAPKGEAFGFSISPSGRRIAVFNSVRLYVLQTAALPVGISQDYSIRRRPLAVEFCDEGQNTLAILADQHTVNVYDSALSRLRRVKTIKLDYPCSCIALSPTGGLLATGYEGGVEIFSLAKNALSTDRRAVRSVRMDKLAFSADSSTLLGTTLRINASSSVVVSVPVFPSAASGVATYEELKEAWCTGLLHPENIRNSSHATFLRENMTTTNERLFAWNGLADTFGILNVADLQYGSVDFPVVISPPLSTCGGLGAAIHSSPAIDQYGDTVAMIVNDRTVRLYLVPHRADDDDSFIEAHSIDHELDEGYGCPFSEARWVYSSSSVPVPRGTQTLVRGRLIVPSPGGVDTGLEELSVEGVEGGRIILFDFDPQFSGQPGQTCNLVLGKSPPQDLEEEEIDVAEQVALARKRTVNQSKSTGLSQRPMTLGKAAANFSNGKFVRSGNADNHSYSRSSAMSISGSQSEATRSLPDLLEGVDHTVSIEEPYAQNMPRSQASLQRAATNAQRHRYQALEEQHQTRGRTNLNGSQFLPLPEYSEEPNAPLPNRFRAMAGLDPPLQAKNARPRLFTNGADFASSSSGVDAHTAPPHVGNEFNVEETFRAATAALNASSSRPRHVHQHSEPTHNVTGEFRTMQTGPTIRDSIMDERHFTAPGPTHDPAATVTPAQHALLSPISDLNSPADTSLWPTGPGSVSPIDESDHENDFPRPLPPPVANGGLARNGVQTNLTFESAPASSTATSSVSDLYNNTVSSMQTYSPVSPPRHPHPNMGAVLPQSALAGATGPHIGQTPSHATQTSASLFPIAQSPTHLPFRTPHVKASAVAHPITDWRPPAASSRSAGSATPDPSPISRQSSLTVPYTAPPGRPSTQNGNLMSQRERQIPETASVADFQQQSSVARSHTKSRKPIRLMGLSAGKAASIHNDSRRGSQATTLNTTVRNDSKCMIM